MPNSSIAISGKSAGPGNQPSELPSSLRNTRRCETDVSRNRPSDLICTTRGSTEIQSSSQTQSMTQSPLVSQRGNPMKPARCSTGFSATRTSMKTSFSNPYHAWIEDTDHLEIISRRLDISRAKQLRFGKSRNHWRSLKNLGTVSDGIKRRRVSQSGCQQLANFTRASTLKRKFGELSRFDASQFGGSLGGLRLRDWG